MLYETDGLFYGDVYKCDRCKKEFHVLSREEWAYKIPMYKAKANSKGELPLNGGRTFMFCSWHCIQEFRRETPVTDQRGKKSKGRPKTNVVAMRKTEREKLRREKEHERLKKIFGDRVPEALWD